MLSTNRRGTLCRAILAACVLAAPAWANTSGPTYQVDWADPIASSLYDVVFEATTDAAGNVFVVGETQGDLAGKVGDYDGYVRKLDPQGTPLWTRQYGTANRLSAFDALATDAAGNAYVGGHLNGSREAFITKLAPDGSTLWSRSFNLSSPDFASVNALVVGDAGDLYFTGSTSGNLFGPNPGGGGNDVFLGQLNPATGATVWTAQLGTAGDEIVYAIDVDAAGDLYLAGATRGDFTGGTPGNAGSFDAFYGKFSPTNGLEWVNQLGGTAFDSAFRIKASDDGGVNVLADVRNTGRSYIKTDANGNIVIDQAYSTGPNEAVLLNNDGDFVEVQFDPTGLPYPTPTLPNVLYQGLNGDLLMAGGNGENIVEDRDAYIAKLVVPEPGSLALLGFGGLIGMRRRRG